MAWVSKTSRPVVYKKLKVDGVSNEKPFVSARTAKHLLGWEEETEKKSFDQHYVKELVGLYPRKVRCTNNITNRPLSRNQILTLRQEILRCRWQLNGDSPIIIGKTGLVLNGQHTLIALILADWEASREPEKWPHYSENPPTIHKLVVYGISETDDVVNTIDTGKPRSLSDVIYRSGFLADKPQTKKRAAASALGHAIRLLWDRTGAKANAYAPIRTHAESLAFLENHPKLLECVTHIIEEDNSRRIRQYVAPGYAAGLLYLMGSAAVEDIKQYYKLPTEENLDWSCWSLACDFWTLLAGNASEMLPVLKQRGVMATEGKNSARECMALIVKAWKRYFGKQEITSKDLTLKYKTDEDGYCQLVEAPTVGGIDLGDNAKPRDIAAILREAKPQAKPKAKSETGAKPQTKRTKSKSSKSNGRLTVGKIYWSSEGSEPWRGKALEIGAKSARLKICQGFQGAGNVKRVRLSSLTTSQPR